MLGKWTALAAALGVAAIAKPAAADAPDARVRTAAPKKKLAKKGKRGPVFSGRLATKGEIRQAPLERPSGHIEIFAVNFRERVVVDLYDEEGDFDEEALDKLNHLWRCKRTGTEKSVDPRVFETLSRIYDHFGKELELVSGFRNQQRVTSYHFHGSAADVRIPGVSDKELHKFVSSLDTGNMGLGIYPRAGFIHVDARPTPSFRWVDRSPPGTEGMGHPKKKKSAGKRIASRTTNS